MIKIRKYIGTYRVFAPIDQNTGKTTSNTLDTYLKASRCKIECYRQDSKTLALYFPTGNSGTNLILPQLDSIGVKYKLHIDGDYESVYTFAEKDLEKVHSILKFQTKGKDIKPESVKTSRRQKVKTKKDKK